MIPSSALLAFSSPLSVTKFRVLFTFSGQKKERLILSIRKLFGKESRNRKINWSNNTNFILPITIFILPITG